MGYKKNLIEKYFSKKFKSTIIKENYKIIKTKMLNKSVSIYLIDTGLKSGTGGRLKIANNIIKNKKDFLMTYCDGLATLI